MRVVLAGAAVAVVLTGHALAATKLTPKEIQTEFFDGKTFVAATTSGGAKYKMVFTADGTASREPEGRAGQKAQGTWKLSKDGYCTAWDGKPAICYTVVQIDKNKWSVVKGATTVAVWSK